MHKPDFLSFLNEYALLNLLGLLVVWGVGFGVGLYEGFGVWGVGFGVGLYVRTFVG
jgi:hypothetical protein